MIAEKRKLVFSFSFLLAPQPAGGEPQWHLMPCCSSWSGETKICYNNNNDTVHALRLMMS